jgi:hypothetical protein
MTAVGGGEHPGFVVIARSNATKRSILSWRGPWIVSLALAMTVKWLRHA